MTPAKRKKIYVARNEARGDISISGGEARIRLTPKVILLFIALVVSAVAVVFFAARQSHENAAQPQQETSIATLHPESTATDRADSSVPVISFAEIVPNTPTATRMLELKFDVIGTVDQPMTVTFRWFVNGTQVQEGENTQLLPGSYKKGSVVHAEVIAVDQQGNAATLATKPVTIINSPPSLSLVNLGMSAGTGGMVITATPSLSDFDDDPLTCSYQWRVNNAPSGAATSQNTFSTSNLTRQDAISVTVSCSDGEVSSEQVTTPAITLSSENKPPEITSTAPESVENGVYTYQAAAVDPDGDNLAFRLDRGPAGITIDPTGLIQWTVPKGAMYTGRHEIPVKFTVTDGNGGSISQEFMIVLVDYVAY